MAVAAIAAVLVGGWLFAVAMALVCVVICFEWSAMTVREDTGVALALSVPVVVAIVLAAALEPAWAVIIVVAGAAAVGLILRSAWAAAGVVYASALGVGLVLLRADAVFGVEAVFFVFAVVWGSDVAAYFAGRAIGGPKLWPRVSPKKTWSGFIGGTVVGSVAGVIVAAVAGVPITLALVLVAALLSVLSAGGDLFESSVKRRFGKKDSGTLIPGHGGVMDRVDGLLFASGAAAVIGAVHGAWPVLGAGLLLW